VLQLSLATLSYLQAGALVIPNGRGRHRSRCAILIVGFHDFKGSGRLFRTWFPSIATKGSL